VQIAKITSFRCKRLCCQYVLLFKILALKRLKVTEMTVTQSFNLTDIDAIQTETCDLVLVFYESL